MKHKAAMGFAWVAVVSSWAGLATLYSIVKGML
jgi:hypothetical protein